MDTSSAIAAALSGKQTRIEKVDTPEIMIRKAAQAQVWFHCNSSIEYILLSSCVFFLCTIILQSVYSSWRAVLHAHMDTRTAAQKNREAAAAAAALSMVTKKTQNHCKLLVLELIEIPLLCLQAEDGLTVASDQNDDRQLLNISPNLGYLYKAIGKPRKSAFRPTKQFAFLFFAIFIFSYFNFFDTSQTNT
jgi:hypothetical protein